MTEEQKTKPCLFCGEEIMAVAVKCKHCSSDLSQLIAFKNAGALQADLKQQIHSIIRSDKPAKTKTLFFAPDIPADKLLRAREKYAAKLNNDEDILVLGENRSMGFFYSGFVLSDRNIYYYGVNKTKDTITGDPRKGVIPLHQIKSLEFKEGGFLGSDHFVLNGMGPDESDLIPKCFVFGDIERPFLTKLFTSIQSTLGNLGGEVQKAQPPPSVVSLATPTSSKRTVKTDNPIEAGKKPKPGCFKSGCFLIAGLILLAISLLALFVGLTAS